MAIMNAAAQASASWGGLVAGAQQHGTHWANLAQHREGLVF